MTPPPAPSPFAGVRVLVIEDDDNLRPLIGEMLRRMGVEAIEHAIDGREALDKASAQRFDVAICDWNLPRVSGIEVLERLHAEAPGMRFLMTTGRKDVESVRRAKEGGASAYLVKPFSEAQLRSKFAVLAHEALLSPNRGDESQDGDGRAQPAASSPEGGDGDGSAPAGPQDEYAPLARAAKPRALLHGIKVIVADSSPRICGILEKHLGSRGADVACATTGEEAVLRLHGVAPFHVAIIDAALKGKVTGRGFAAHVGSKGTAVLFTLQGEKAQAPEPCGAPLLMKPFQLSALDDAVDRLLGTPGAPEDGAAAAPA